MGEEDDGNGKVPWRTVTLWIIASCVGGTVTYVYSLSSSLTGMEKQHAVVLRTLDDHSKRIELIETTKTDKRFRSDDWERERRVLDAEFKSLWKAVEDCRRPQKM